VGSESDGDEIDKFFKLTKLMDFEYH